MLFALDHEAVEAVAEEVAGSGVFFVEPLRVAAVEELHPGSEVGAGALEDEVVVVPHQAEGVHRPAVAADRELEQAEKEPAVEVVEVDQAAVDAAGRDVEEAVRQQAPRNAWHAPDGSAGSAENLGRAEVVALLAHFLDPGPRLTQPRPGTVP